MVQTAVTIDAPLSPKVMSQAQVPFDDALWFARQRSPRAKVKALRTPRGERILKHVREFMQKTNAHHAMPMGV
ncbi:MAG: hypothetical protein Q7T63_14620 [Burkholderiaceae bacterium]|nr:hypothetical protein [Burkholderiaceae bacterium]